MKAALELTEDLGSLIVISIIVPVEGFPDIYTFWPKEVNKIEILVSVCKFLVFELEFG